MYYTRGLCKSLSSLERPGDFAFGELINNVLPGLQITGLSGLIALPLQPFQADQIKVHAEQAPFGRAEHTLIDTSVRNTWQLDPTRFQLSNPAWPAFVQQITEQTCTALGVTTPASVQPQLYKLLLYEAHSFFLPHRDTEHSPGMFAALAISLPSQYQGGQLKITHGQNVKVLDFAPVNTFNTCAAAFYEDCQHEIQEVTSGYRLSLIYNLVHTGQGSPPEPVDRANAAATLLPVLQAWEADCWGPTKLVWMLEHRYSEAGLTGLKSLKNHDRAVAETLWAAAQSAGVEAYLVKFVQHKSGQIEEELEIGNLEKAMDQEDENIEPTGNEGVNCESAIDAAELAAKLYPSFASEEMFQAANTFLKALIAHRSCAAALQLVCAVMEAPSPGAAGYAVPLDVLQRMVASVLDLVKQEAAICDKGTSSYYSSTPSPANQALVGSLLAVLHQCELKDGHPLRVLMNACAARLVTMTSTGAPQYSLKVDAPITCTCAACQKLAKFLANDQMTTERLPLRYRGPSSYAGSWRYAHSTLPSCTDRIVSSLKGSLTSQPEQREEGAPTFIMLTKTDAAHKARLSAYNTATSLLSSLRSLLPAGSMGEVATDLGGVCIATEQHTARSLNTSGNILHQPPGMCE
ncbi:hypothetical protein WJX72_010900 [[Myrmecia] bisecta]|uniref:Prolyl 4-hydroxylase alpha subunit Fe(2+) 2OG dioxygenase domain-containing protein n=1 Tax=[Myrmecia] bisecta TaxID=41462 RepID=A0AAW1PH33_9CHLO